MSKRAPQRHEQDARALSKEQFAALMRFPKAWLAWEMYTDEVFRTQRDDYTPGSEAAPEHYRYGAFRWLLSRPLTDEVIRKYVALTFLDPDQAMAESARRDLASAKTLSPDLEALLTLRVPV